MTLAKIQPNGVKIDRLIQNISDGHIKIPAFQRGFVWSQEQVIDLLDSIYNDYPIGSILLWNSSEHLRSTRNIGGLLIPDLDPDYPVNYVLDGQQRLSAIYGVLAPNKQVDPRRDSYQFSPDIFEIFFDLQDKVFLPRDAVIPQNPLNYGLFEQEQRDGRYLPLGAFFSPRSFHEEARKIQERYLDLAYNIQSKFQNYEVPVVTIKDRTKEEVGVIFERINNTGTKLSTVDLMVAWTWSEDFHLRDKIDDILKVLANKGFGDIPEKRVLQCLSAITKQTVRTEDILRLDSELVRRNIDRLKSSLEKTVDFLSTELNVHSGDFLPHSHQIIPLTYFFSRVTYPDRKQSEILQHWFWATSFSRRYAGATDVRVNEDVVFFEQILKKRFGRITRYSHDVTEEQLINQDFDKRSPITRAFLLLLAQRGPRDLLHGRKIDLGNTLSFYNQKEYHHIFPRDFLRSRGTTRNIDSICNFCLLPSTINKQVSNRPPSVYLMGKQQVGSLFTEQQPAWDDTRVEILESNLMPTIQDVYLNDNFEEFLRRRAKLILSFLESRMTASGSEPT